MHPVQEELESALGRLGASRSGLSTAEARRRLERFGPNEPGSAPVRSKLWEFVRFSANPVVLVLLAAAGASALLRQVVDAAIILAMVSLGSILNFWQTYRSERAARRLKEQVNPTATVMRDGAPVELPRRALVPGDVVRLSAGDLVPADARLLESRDLHVQQAALTGESLPAAKRAVDGRLAALGPESPALVFLGTSVVSGGATAVVYETGRRTSFGDIVERLSERPEETEFERGTREFGVLILKTVLFLVLFVLIVNVSAGRDALEALLFSVALAVGLTPEYLPMITTVTLAQGAVRMARRKVIVKHLSAIQNLGSIDVLCSDKTGTLTTGVMSLETSIDALGGPSPRALFLARLNSRLQSGIKSPFDAAVLAAPPPASGDEDGYLKTDEIPFDFERRRLSVVVKGPAGRLLITKGAPESVLEVSSMDDDARRRLLALFEALSGKGLRVLAVASREVDAPSGFAVGDERDLTFAGYVTFADHLAERVAPSLEALRRDGVRVMILSGDNERVTRRVCEQAGVDASRVATGSEVELLDEAALEHVAENVGVFARLSPAQKHRVILALKRRGHVVGFLGDGINDAPSLHAADVGISVAGAVDIAREASDILLLERRLEVLHAGIIAGRKSFGNVFKYLLMGTSSNFGNMLSMAVASLFLPFLPMLPTQILLNNFLYDLAQVTIPTDTVDPGYVRSPQRWKVRVIRDFMLVIGPLSSLYDFVTFFVLLRVFHFDEARFHTGWFVESLSTQALVLFVIRTVGRPWTNRPSVPLAVTTLGVVAVGAVLPGLPAAGAIGFAPLSGWFYAFLLLVVASYLALVEAVKRRLMRRLIEPGGMAPALLSRRT